MVVVLSAKAVIDGEITFGMMLAIQSIGNQMSSPVSQLIGFIYSFQDVRISMERINEIKHLRSERNTQEGRQGVVPGGSVCLRNLSFKYDVNSPTWTLRNISFTIPQGKTVAIVGSSGSGKTTLLKLLLGYYENFEGDIDIGGTALKDCDINKWREMCGVVMPEGKIFMDSIVQNIAVSDETPDEQRLAYSARTACIYDYIQSLPLGFNTIIGQNGKGPAEMYEDKYLYNPQADTFYHPIKNSLIIKYDSPFNLPFIVDDSMIKK